MAVRGLRLGSEYDWGEIGRIFGFSPNYLSAAGGMPISSAADAVLCITHPTGGKSFNYQDYWDGDDLIYTGRGQNGDQSRSGANRDVAENRRTIYIRGGRPPAPQVPRFASNHRGARGSRPRPGRQDAECLAVSASICRWRWPRLRIFDSHSTGGNCSGKNTASF
jgi:hypothetical protein